MTSTMKRSTTAGALRAGFAALAAATLTLVGIVPAAADDDVIQIEDDALRACIAEALTLDPGEEITASDAAGIGYLTCHNAGVSTLEGLQHLTGLTQFFAHWNPGITSIAPIIELPLEQLGLHGTNIEDLALLAHLDSIRELQLRQAGMSDLGPLQNLTELRVLLLEENGITDISPIANLDLEDLWLSGNDLGDQAWSVIAGFENLTGLRLDDTNITTLASLAGHTGLTELFVAHNHIEDVGPLAGLESLNHLRLNNNAVTDVSALPVQINPLYLADQTVDLGELHAGVPRANPVVGADGQPVELDGPMYDATSNTFTPQPGESEITWSDDGFTGVLTFTVADPADLEVTTTAQPATNERYEWDVVLDSDGVVTVPEGTDNVEVDYALEGRPSGPTHDGFRITGDVRVVNNNPTAVDAVISVELDDDDLTCEVHGGGDVDVAPGGTEAIASYTCHLPDDTATDAQFTVTATVTWDEQDLPGTSGTASGSATADFGETEPDRYDSYRGLAFEHHDAPADAGFDARQGEQSYPYSIEWEAPEAGQCEDFTTHAGLTDDGIIQEEDSATVSICVEAPLQVTKNPTATFDRQYLWDIDKSVTTDGVVDERNEAVFDYLVQVDLDGFIDSNWTMAGQIEVTNPNTFGQITFDLDQVSDLDDAQCTVDNGTGVVLAGGESVPLDYECTFAGAPEYEDTSTATVTWVDPAGEPASASGSAEVAFDVAGEIDALVQVWHDHTDPANPVLLGEADQGDADTWTFAYSLTLPGVVGAVTQFTNTAWVEVTGENPQASTTVEIEIDPEAAPGAAPGADPAPGTGTGAGLPATGAPPVGAVALALLLLTAGWALVGRFGPVRERNG